MPKLKAFLRAPMCQYMACGKPASRTPQIHFAFDMDDPTAQATLSIDLNVCAGCTSNVRLQDLLIPSVVAAFRNHLDAQNIRQPILDTGVVHWERIDLTEFRQIDHDLKG